MTGFADPVQTALNVRDNLHHWYASEKGRKYAASTFEPLLHHIIHRPGRNREEMCAAIGITAHLSVTEPQAAPFAVSADICALLEAAAPSVPLHELAPSDVPVPVGFVWLESGIVVADDTVEEKPFVVHGFAWHLTTDAYSRDGMLLILFTDPSDQRDHLRDDFLHSPQWTRAMAEGFVPPQNLWSMVGGIWPLDGPPPATGSFRLLLAFLRFIGEPWLVDEEVTAPRPFVRRAARAGLPEPKVRIIELRKRPPRAAAGASEHRPVEWTHRWMVGAGTGGFWRNQWYPARGVHRPKFILPFEKGPAFDADGNPTPLVVNRTVFRVDR